METAGTVSVQTSGNAIEWIVGALFVAIYAYGRYNTPPQNRSTTTCGLFILVFVLYVHTLWAVYWIFGILIESSPESLTTLMAMLGTTGFQFPDQLKNLTGPVVAALILSAFLPSFPWIKRVDEAILRAFWDLGKIPGNSIILANKMRRAPYVVPQRVKQDVEAKCRSLNISESFISFEGRNTPEFEWSRITALVVQLETWHNFPTNAVRRFVQENSDELRDIHTKYNNLAQRAVSCLNTRKQIEEIRENGGQVDAQLDFLMQENDRIFFDESARLYKFICRYIARAALATRVWSAQRSEFLVQMGFNQDAVRPNGITLNQLIVVVLAITGCFFAVSVLEAFYKHEDGMTGRGNFKAIVFQTFLMSFTFGVAVVSSLFPKNRWSFASRDITRTRPVVGYLFSGCLAVLLGYMTMIAVRYSFTVFNRLSVEQNWDNVVGSLSWSYPYLLLSFTIGAATAYLADNYALSEGTKPKWLRWADGAALLAVVAAASVVTYYWMEGSFLFGEGTKDPKYKGRVSLPFFVLKGMAVGFVIGVLVPHWYRLNKQIPPGQYLKLLMQDKRQAIQDEWRQVGRNEEVLDGLLFACAYVAASDGHVDDVERQQLQDFLEDLTAVGNDPFDLDEAILTFNNFADQIVDAHRRGDDLNAELKAEFEGLEVFRGRSVLSDMLVYLCLSVGRSDSTFEVEELATIEKLLETLKLDRGRYNLQTGHWQTA